MKKLLFTVQSVIVKVCGPRPGPWFATKIYSFKSYLMLLLTIAFFMNIADAQLITENFDESTTVSNSGGTGMPTSYSTGNYILTSGTWAFTTAEHGTAGTHSASGSCQLQSATGSAIISPAIAGGVGVVTFWGSSTTTGSVQVNYSTDGGTSYTAATGSPFTSLTTTVTQWTATINSGAASILIQLKRTAGTVLLDDINTTSYATNYYWNGSNTTALNAVWNNAATNWSSPASQATLNAIWPATGIYAANFNSAAAASAITIPATIAVMPYSINIGTSNYSFITASTTAGSLSSSISLNANTLTLAPISTANLNLSGIISGTGALSLKGGGTGTNIGGAVVLSNSNTYSGNTSVGAASNNAQLQLDPSGFIANTAITVNSNSQLYLNGTSGAVYNQGLTILTINGGGNSTNTGALRAANNNVYTWNGAITVASNATIATGTSSVLGLSGIITSGTNLLTKEGSGTLLLNATGNNGTGGWLVNNGTLKLGASGVLPDADNVAISTGASFDMAGFSEIIGSIGGAGIVTSGASGTPVLTEGGDNTNTIFSGVIQNGTASNLSVVKSGTGIFTLSGINTYSGTTTINAGTINVSGSLVAASTVTIAASGTLTGTGIVNGAVIVSGMISPNGVGTAGTLTTGNLTLNPGGIYTVDITTIPTSGTAGTNWDKLVTANLTNSATAGSPFTFAINGTIASFSNATSYSWLIGTYTGATPSLSNIIFNTTGLTNSLAGGSFSISFAANAMTLLFTPLPNCIAPTLQPTALVLSPISSSVSIPVSFTVATGNPSGYLVLRTSTSATPTTPQNGTAYTVGSTALGGYVEMSSASLSFTSISLSANTSYWYWVYAYNSTSCAGGPVYLTISPLTGTATTATPLITINQTSLIGLSYSQGYGASVSQFYNLSATYLATSSGSITVAGTTDYEVSSDNTSFFSSKSIAYTAYTLSSTAIYVRLKAGLLQGDYNGESIMNTGGGSIAVAVSCNGSVGAAPTTIAGWDVSGQFSYGTSPLDATTISSNLIITSGLTRGSGVGTGGAAVSNGWGGNTFTATSAANAITANEFYTFSMQSTTGYLLSLASLNPFNYRRSTTGPPSALLQYQLNAGSFIDITTLSFPSTSTSGASLSPININGITALQNIPATSIVTFRIVPYNASSSVGTFYIFDVNTSGSDLSVIGSFTALQPAITSNLIDSTTYGVTSNYAIVASNIPSSYTATNLPMGMVVNAATGIISVAQTTLPGTYAITIAATNSAGTGSAALSYTIKKASLIVTALDQTKAYGSTLILGIKAFATIGNINGDSVATVDLSSIGATYTASIGSYFIVPQNASGIGLDNYILTFINGSLAVNPGVHGLWVGVVNSSFNDTRNWEDCQLIVLTDNVTIPAGINFYPVLNSHGNSSLTSLTINDGASFSINSNDTLQIAGVITSGNSLLVNGTIVFNGSSSQYIAANCFVNNTIQNLSINNSSGVTLQGLLNLKGVLNPIQGTFTTGGFLVLKSTALSTARIAQGVGNYLVGNVSVERFIPAKTVRKYDLLGSSINQTIGDAWQQQIYITGLGSGGQACGTGTGFGGTTDKFNINGFDKSAYDVASMYIYAANKVNGSRWVSIGNTNSTLLTPGIGYKINIRGNRNVGSCLNEITSANPVAPDTLTLSAFGDVSKGDVATTLNDMNTHLYTLLANPYPCPISIHSFLANNTILNNKIWTYSPSYGNGNYTTFSNGIFTNQVSGYDATNGDYVASGQAFFVEANANGNALFHESDKTDGIIPNVKYFGESSDKLLRIGLRGIDSILLDEIVIRFTNATISNSYDSSTDAVSFGGGNQTLVSFKGNSQLAIANHSVKIGNDTLKLGVNSTTTGRFSLMFSGFNALDNSFLVRLRDHFVNQEFTITNNSNYAFNITTDLASKGNNRFELIVSSTVTLSVVFISVDAKLVNGVGVVSWKVATENNIQDYQVERSSNGSSFNTMVAPIKAMAGNVYSSIDKDLSASINYYRIKAMGNTETIYSKIVSLDNSSIANSSIKIYPTIVRDASYTVQLTNEKAGSYSLVLINMLGQSIAINSIIHAGGNASLIIQLPAKLAVGSYELLVLKDGIILKRERLVVE